ncbi:MAG: radical SAM protein [Thermoguttaceae bacterium]|nr:radical SAM protein [Thermoguttaceae bacterium]MDW8078032.1 radical SAM protein [Thermoguttaceae bacterium]
MSTTVFPTAPELVAFVQAEDPHAQHHLALLRQAEDWVRDAGRRGTLEACRLAARLERWRYQHLRERQGRWDSRDWQLADRLDELARQLAGRQPLPPRWTYQALASAQFDPAALNEALAALNPCTPLEKICQQARQITEANFSVDISKPGLVTGISAGEAGGLTGQGQLGAKQLRKRRMFMYAPLYLSSFCVNYCAYCGFRFPEPIERRHLTRGEARQEAEALRQLGFRHILLVTGDYPQLVSPHYLAEIASDLCQLGIHPGVEIAPLDTDGYETLVRAGVRSITLYQETYDLGRYEKYHPRGPKSSFLWRLEGLDRAAEAGMRRLGLGILLGLGEPQTELVQLMRHGVYLERRFPGRRIAFSLPRIHEAPSDFAIPHPVDDETFIRLYCALRIAFPRAELVLSTRERPELRDYLARVCITQMSAGSSTAPGGYTSPAEVTGLGKQFPVHDSRPAPEVFRSLEEAGFHLVWQID